MEFDSKYLNEMCTWLRETKGITKIEVFELADYKDEFETYKANNGDIQKVEESDIGC